MWTDGRTDITKLILAFRNFANARERPKNDFVRRYDILYYKYLLLVDIFVVEISLI